MATLLLNSFTYPFSIHIRIDYEKDGHIYERLEFYLGRCSDIHEDSSVMHGQHEMKWYFTDINEFKRSLNNLLNKVEFESIHQQSV